MTTLLTVLLLMFVSGDELIIHAICNAFQVSLNVFSSKAMPVVITYSALLRVPILWDHNWRLDTCAKVTTCQSFLRRLRRFHRLAAFHRYYLTWWVFN